MLTCQKSLFRLPEGAHYLNCAYMSPLPRPVEEAGIRGLQRKRNPAAIAADDFFSESDGLRRRFAKLVGIADPASVAIIPAASYGIAVAAKNTPLVAGQNVVLLEEQFPSNVYSWRRACREQDAELRAVSPPEGGRSRGEAWNAQVLEAIDGSTAVVALPNVHWSDGTLFDLREIGRRAREVGAALVVDGTQSVGALPFDVGDVQPDALVCAGYKTLFGPYSIGVAYFGPRYSEGVPLEENWAPRLGSEDFARLVDYTEDYQPGAIRFDVGERSNFVLVPMLSAGLDLVLDWDPAAVQEYCVELVRGPLQELRELGFWVEREERRAAHLFGLRPPAGLDLETLRSLLEQEQVSVSVRGSAIRVSPHVYNDGEDLAALVRALRTAVGAGEG